MREKQSIPTLLCFILGLLLAGNQAASAIEAVASVKAIKGPVDIKRDDRTIAARTGLILHDKDLVVTHTQSRITIMFRDGSLIRLFPNTKFLIEKSEEAPAGPRGFLHKFRLKLGSFWGKFTRNRQKTVINSPTATVGIKGTTVALAARDELLQVSLTTGTVQIENQTEAVELEAGQFARNIPKNGSFSQNIETLRYQLIIRPDKGDIQVPEPGNTEELYFTLQLVDLKTNKNLERSGDVYISIATDNIVFDENIYLNNRGYARVKATISAPEKIPDKVDTVEVFALMDGEEHLDIKAGSTILFLEYPEGINKRLKIDASSGEVDP